MADFDQPNIVEYWGAVLKTKNNGSLTLLFCFNNILGSTARHDPVRMNLEIPVPGLDVRDHFPEIFVVTNCYVNGINTAKRHLIKDRP